MTKPRSKEIAEFVAVSSIIASLIFVGLQLRQDKQFTAAQVRVESDGLVFDLSQMVSEGRDIWIRGLNGEELSEHDELTFRAVAIAVEQRHRGIAQRAPLLGTGTEGNRAKRFAHILCQYPGLRRVFLGQVNGREMLDAAVGRSTSTMWISISALWNLSPSWKNTRYRCRRRLTHRSSCD